MLVLSAVATPCAAWSRPPRSGPSRRVRPPPHERRVRIEHHAAVRRSRAAGATRARSPARQEAPAAGHLPAARLLAIVSTLFGMMMAVASDLPDLENRKEYQDARNSVLVDSQGQTLGVLTNNQSRVLVRYQDLSSYMSNAIIAIEDRRFYENSGVDVRGIGRALVQDVLSRKAAQGGSTIAQQFVKNALRAQSDRTVFQKMREAALAYHLTRKWPKSKILTEYLNSIYFGNGAYGVESAARTYFGNQPDHKDCGTRTQPVRQGAQARGGRADRRRRGQPDGLRPRRPSAGGPGAAQPRAQEHVRPGAAAAARVPRRAHPGPPGADRHQAAHGQDQGAVLHDLGAPAARRPVRRPQGVRGRPEGQDDARPRAPGRRPRTRSTSTWPTRRGRRPPWWPSTTRPARCARWSAGATTRRGRSTSPPRASASPARRSSRSSSPRRSRRATAPGSLWPSRKRDLHRPGHPGQGEVRRQQLREQVRGHPDARRRPDLLRQLRLLGGRHLRRDEEDRGAGRAHGHPHAGLVELRDDARRPQAGRHAARHGPRLRDLHRGRPAHRRHPGRGRRRARRHPGGRLAERQDAQDRTTSRASPSSTARSPTRRSGS